MPSLDGLRAVAVLTVMFFHLESHPFLPGGNIGVDLFFVLSGFLITTLLIQEWVGTGSISLIGFYQRRVLRLLPAVVAFVCVYVTIALVFRDSEFSSEASADIVLRNAALVGAYCFNWVHALEADPGRGFGHLWSLSVEEQFYLVWPLVLLLLLKWRSSALSIILLTSGAIVLSASLPGLMTGDWARFYFGTDFRMQSLLAGSLLGQLYVSGILRDQVIERFSFQCALIISIGFLATTVVLVRNDSAFLFVGGHTVVAICCGLLVARAVFRPSSFYTRMLSNRVLVYVGRRSYALYLWHFAIGYWLRSLEPLPHVAVCLLLSFVAAELSYRLVEAPALRLKSRLGKPSEDSKAIPTGTFEPGTAA